MTPPVVSVASPGELLAAVPHLLGFVPRQSLVLVGLRPPRGRVRLTARADLPGPGAENDVVRAVLPAVVHGRCTEAVAVVYLDDIALTDAGLPHAVLVEQLGQSLSRHHVGLRDAVCVSGGRFRSYLCRDETCCDPRGALVPPLDGSALAPHTVLRGRQVWASREDLVASLAPGSAREQASVRRAVDDAIDDLVARLADGTPVPALRQETLRAFAQAVTASAAGTPVPTTARAALLVGLADIVTRDAIIAASFDADPAEAVPLLERLTREAPAPYVAPVAVLLAWHAYAGGDGALASVAVERALAADPGHSLARLVDQGLRSGLPPDALREIARSSRAQVSARLRGPDATAS